MKQHTLIVEIHTRKKDGHLVDGLIDQLARVACDIANSNEDGVHLIVRDGLPSKALSWRAGPKVGQFNTNWSAWIRPQD